jgi:O-antigen/teichoic acid export membrane protein
LSAIRSGRRWFRGDGTSRAATTLVDQGVASASNFAVAIVVARLSGPAGLGAFALAYAAWILLTMVHRSLITDPMVIMGDLRGDQKDEFVRRGFAADVTFGATAACVIAVLGAALVAVGAHAFGVGLLSVTPWIPVLLLQDYWRQMGFMTSTPKKSLMNDLVFNAVQALAFVGVFLAGLHSVFAVVSAWGLGAAVAAVYGLRQFSVSVSLRGGSAHLWSRWHTSRWLAGERMATWGGGQLYLILAGALLGPAALGGLKASQGLMAGPTSVFINAGGSFGFPEASRQLAERGRTGLVRVTRFVTGAGVSAAAACGIAVLVAAPTLLKLLYGPAFVGYAPAARVYAVSVVVGAFGTGPMLTLMTTRRLRSLFVLQSQMLAFSIAAVCVLATAYGVTGAAASNLLTNVVSLAIILVMQSSARRSIDETPPRSAVGTLEAPQRRVLRGFNNLIGMRSGSRGDLSEEP